MIESRWLILGVLFLARIAMGFQFQTVASTAPFLIERLAIGYAEIGTLIGLYHLPGVVISLPGGLLSRRFGDKLIGGGGIALMVLGSVMMGLSHDYGLVFTGRLLTGIGAILFNLVLTKMVTDWFAGREIETAMGVILASWPLGIGIGLVVQGSLASAYGSSAVMYAAAAVSAIALLLTVTLYRAPSPIEPVPAAAPSPAFELPSFDETLPTILSGIMWGCFNVGLIIFFSFTPQLLVEQGLPPLKAATMVSVALWLSAVSVPLCGYLVQRTGWAVGAIVFFSSLAGLALAALPSMYFSAALCVAVGLAIGPPAGAIVSLPARILSPRNRSIGLGIFYTSSYVVFAAGPAAAGMLRDHWRSASAPLMFGAVLFFAVIPLLLVIQGWIFWRPAGSRA